MKKHLLVVDDDTVSRELLKEVLAGPEVNVELAGSGEEALDVLRRKNIPVVLSDIRMLELSGLDLLRKIKEQWPETIVVLMTGFGSVEGALQAIREGAFDYISKPFQMQELRALVDRAFRQSEIAGAKQPKDRETVKLPQETLIGKSPRIVEVYRMIARAALAKSHVFLTGEMGTGKSLVARTIHGNSADGAKRSVLELTQESSVSDWSAAVSAAGNVDLLIEDVSELTQEKQAFLSRILDEVESGAKTFRVFSLSRVPLREIEEKKLLKSDLFYRLSTLSIELPALRERLEDLPELVELFLSRHSNVSHLSPQAFQLLREYSWPGNLRELRQLIERAIALAKGPVLEPDDFPSLQRAIARGQDAPEGAAEEKGPNLSAPGKSAGLEHGRLEDLEKEYIQKALEQTNYNKSKAAEMLGIDRATLYRKCKTYGIDVRAPKDEG